MLDVAKMRSDVQTFRRSDVQTYSLPVKSHRYTNYSMSHRRNLAGHFLCLSAAGRL
ncbi:MAG: hypothetical protein IJP54_01390 [Synergistaceae bacterium]|nr:hypothetical protein [Synergistaceae bacterium]MBR0034304.1 hypothetical protein [Synergistaceae bacterium]